jgi:hypothetical protein
VISETTYPSYISCSCINNYFLETYQNSGTSKAINLEWKTGQIESFLFCSTESFVLPNRSITNHKGMTQEKRHLSFLHTPSIVYICASTKPETSRPPSAMYLFYYKVAIYLMQDIMLHSFYHRVGIMRNKANIPFPCFWHFTVFMVNP